MSLSRKDYTAIASRLNDILWQRGSDPATVVAVAYSIAEYFGVDNSLFDVNKFIAVVLSEDSDAAKAFTK